jgi:hypothetical protein
MRQREPTNRNRRREPDQAEHHRKESSEPRHGQAKNRTSADSETTSVEAARLLAHTNSDVERSELAIRLQQSFGNAYVQRLVHSQSIQAKLSVNAPGDMYEKEADEVADVVTRNVSSNVQRQAVPEEEEPVQTKRITRLQRQEVPEEEEPVQAKHITDLQRQALPEEEEEPVQARHEPQLQRQEEEEEVQTKRDKDATTLVSPHLESRIDARRGTGQPLPESLRDVVEPQFGHDFSNVRVHTDTQANQLSRQLAAEAFTTGPDIFFKEGAYQPGSEAGTRLLAHELTHTLQQEGVEPRELPPTARTLTTSQSERPVAQRQTAEAAGVVLSAGQLLFSLLTEGDPGGLTYQNVTFSNSRPKSQSAPDQPEAQIPSEIRVPLIRLTGFADDATFEIVMNTDGSSILGARTQAVHISGFDGSYLRSTGNLSFGVASYGLPSDSALSALLTFSGVINTFFHDAYCEFTGAFVISADGTIEAREGRITKGDAKVEPWGFGYRLGYWY